MSDQGQSSRYSTAGDRTPEPEHADIPAAYFNDLWEYHLGVSGQGKHAFTWSDKPHRLVYDLTRKLAEERASRSERGLSREPTEVMVQSVRGIKIQPEMVRVIWRSMWDAAQSNEREER